uniref:Uncharacterized protein n=1 Tax=Anguilla anguilla TaxID=7936 RepID=A0A0E9UW61_ANGAN
MTMLVGPYSDVQTFRLANLHSYFLLSQSSVCFLSRYSNSPCICAYL